MNDIDYGPIDFVRRLSRESWESLDFDEDVCMFHMLTGLAVEIARDDTDVVDLDDVPELSVSREGTAVKVELKMATRTALDLTDLLIVGLQSGRRLLLGWHDVHRGRLDREGESTSPKREGAPVSYTFSQALDPLELRLLY